MKQSKEVIIRMSWKEILKVTMLWLLMIYATHIMAQTGYLDSPTCIINK